MKVSKKLFLLLITIVVLLIVGGGVYVYKNTPQKLEIPGAILYPGKVIYKNCNWDGEKCNDKIYRQDCAERKGSYNTCGSSCAPGAEICTADCAFTCEF